MGPKKKRKTNDQEGIVHDKTSNESMTNVSENNAALLQFLISENSSDNPEKNEEVIENSDNGVTTVTKTIIRYKTVTKGRGYEVQQLKRKLFDHQEKMTTLRKLDYNKDGDESRMDYILKVFRTALRGKIKQVDGQELLSVTRSWWGHHYGNFKTHGIIPNLEGRVGRHRAIHPKFDEEIREEVDKRSFAGIGFSGIHQFSRFIKPYLIKSREEYTGIKNPIVRIKPTTIEKLLRVYCPYCLLRGDKQNLSRLQAHVNIASALVSAVGTHSALKGLHDFFPMDPSGVRPQLFTNSDGVSVVINDNMLPTTVHVSKKAKHDAQVRNQGNKTVTDQVEKILSKNTSDVSNDSYICEGLEDHHGYICCPVSAREKEGYDKEGLFADATKKLGLSVEFLTAASPGECVASCVTVKVSDMPGNKKFRIFMLDEESRLFFCLEGPCTTTKERAELAMEKQKKLIFETHEVLREKIRKQARLNIRSDVVNVNNTEAEEDIGAEMDDLHLRSFHMMDGCGPPLNAMLEAVINYFVNNSCETEEDKADAISDQSNVADVTGTDSNLVFIDLDGNEDVFADDDDDNNLVVTIGPSTRSSTKRANENVTNDEEDAPSSLKDLQKDPIISESILMKNEIPKNFHVGKTTASGTGLLQPNDCAKAHKCYKSYITTKKFALKNNRDEGEIPHFGDTLWEILVDYKVPLDRRRSIFQFMINHPRWTKEAWRTGREGYELSGVHPWSFKQFITRWGGSSLTNHDQLKRLESHFDELLAKFEEYGTIYQDDVEAIIGEELLKELDNNLDKDSKTALDLFRKKLKNKPEQQRPLNQWGFTLLDSSGFRNRRKQYIQDKRDAEDRKKAEDLHKKSTKEQKAKKDAEAKEKAAKKREEDRQKLIDLKEENKQKDLMIVDLSKRVSELTSELQRITNLLSSTGQGQGTSNDSNKRPKFLNRKFIN